MEYTFDRLALAWCRLQDGQWDEDILGPAPKEFNRSEKERQYFLTMASGRLEELTSDVLRIYAWHVLYKKDMTVQQWIRWYTVDQYANIPVKDVLYRSLRYTARYISCERQKRRRAAIPAIISAAAAAISLAVLLVRLCL